MQKLFSYVSRCATYGHDRVFYQIVKSFVQRCILDLSEHNAAHDKNGQTDDWLLYRLIV